MNQAQVTFLADDEIAPKVTALVRDAKKWVVLVTPYLDFWGHLKVAIDLGVRKGIKIWVIVRRDSKVLASEDVSWLMENGVMVFAAEDLHAKIYLNETTTIVSSMNLTEYSTKNSHEFALVVQDEQAAQQIRKYVVERVAPIAERVSSVRDPGAQKTSTKPVKSTSRLLEGFCIRGGERIPLALDPFRPLCANHYEVWARWGDEDYPEELCHSCGEPSEVTYAKPLCRKCYRRLFNA